MPPPGKRRDEGGGGGGEERWLLTYADLITLLLAFFILLYATARTDVVRFTEVATMLAKAFKVDVLQGNEPTAAFDTGNIPTIIGGLSGAGAVIGRDLISYAEREQLGDQISVEASEEFIVIRLASALISSSGDDRLRPEGERALDQVAQALRGLPNPIRVEGHTDNVPTSDSDQFATNWELSTARSVVVTRYLIEQGDMLPEQFVAAGDAEHLPIADNSTPQGRKLNRRTEIWVLPEDHSDARRRVPA